LNRDGKLSMLAQLLDRVRKRTTAPRGAAPGLAPSAKESPVEARAAERDVMQPTAPPQPIATPDRASPPPSHAGELSSEPPPLDLDSESEEGPPSAPRLREGLLAESEETAEERDFAADDIPIKTPPPESGRQYVAPVAAASDSSEDVDIDISVTEGEITPLPEEPSTPPPEPAPEQLRMPAPTADMGLPRLSFVSEPEIEFHVRPRAKVPERPVPDLLPTASEAPPPVASVPVRLMAQPAGEGPAAAIPVEVWASTHAPAALHGRVASFVGQNASFDPKSFGELLEATLQLGEDRS
jgi:hypothetical protein